MLPRYFPHQKKIGIFRLLSTFFFLFRLFHSVHAQQNSNDTQNVSQPVLETKKKYIQTEIQSASDQNLLIINEKVLEELVRKNNFDYKRAQIWYNQKLWDLIGIWNHIFPNISGTIQINYARNPQILSNSVEIFSDLWKTIYPNIQDPLEKTFHLLGKGKRGNWNTSVGFNMEMNLSAWTFMSVLKTTSAYNIGKITFQAAKHQISNTAKKAFHRLLLDQKILKLQQSTVNLAKENYKQAINRYQNGIIQRTTLIATQIELENQRNDYYQKNTDYENNLLAFKLIAGIPLEKPIELQGKIIITPKTLDAKRLLNNHTHQNPELLLAQAKVWFDRWESYHQHSSIITPFLNLNYNVQNTSKLRGSFKKTIVSSSNSLREILAWKELLTVSLGVRVQFDSLFSFGKNNLSLWKLRDQLKISKEDSKEALAKAHIDITKSINNINHTLNNIQSLELAYTLSEQNLSLITSGYNNGVQSFIAVKEAIRDRNTALSNYSRAQFLYYSALLDLGYLTNLDSQDLLNYATESSASS